MKIKLLKQRFLLGTVALVAGVGLASAQGMKEGPAAGPAGSARAKASHGASGERRGTELRGNDTRGRDAAGRAETRGMSRGESAERHAPSQAAGERRERSTTGQGSAEKLKKSEPAAKSTGAAKSDQKLGAGTRGEAKEKGSPSKTQNSTTGQGSAEKNDSTRHERSSTTQKGATTGQSVNDSGKAPNERGSSTPNNHKPAASTQEPNTRPNQTTGSAAQGRSAPSTENTATSQTGAGVRTMAGTQITAQQQTTIQQSVLSARNVPRVDNVNFDVHTGVAIPTSVHVVSVSEYPSLIEFFPRYRDDSFFVVEDEIVIVDHSHRIVDVIPAGPRARFSRSSSTTTSVELSEPEIREVQQVLIERGYLHGRVDGVWGPETREALVAFQRKEGIEAHGSVDTRTISALGLSDRIREHGQGVNQSSTSGASERGAQQQPNAAGQQNRGQANTSSPNSSAAGQKPSETGKSSSAQSNEPKGQGGPRDQSTTGQGGRGMEPAQRDKNSPSGSAHETPQRAPAGSTQDQNPRR